MPRCLSFGHWISIHPVENIALTLVSLACSFQSSCYSGRSSQSKRHLGHITSTSHSLVSSGNSLHHICQAPCLLGSPRKGTWQTSVVLLAEGCLLFSFCSQWSYVALAPFSCPFVESSKSGYTHRSIWSAGFLVIGWVWPITWPVEARRRVGSALLVWRTLSCVNMIFPLLSTEKDEHLTLM